MAQPNQPCAQQTHDRAVAPQRPRASGSTGGGGSSERRRRAAVLARGGLWVGVVLCGVALGGCSGSSGGPVAPTGVGPAAKLIFTVQPSNAAAGAGITPAMQVAVQDAQGNTVTTATTSITLAIGTNPASGILSGTVTVAAVNGVATFSTLSLNMVGTGYTLTATATGLTSATSSAFNISAGAAAKVVFTVQPSTAAAGAAITPGVQVAVQDAQGNTVTTATTSITVAVGTNPASGTLAGTKTLAAASGVATFSTLSLNAAGTGYTLTATATGLTGATSNAFSIGVGAAAKLVFTVQPSSAAAGAAIAPGVQVAVQDAQGNTVTTATTSITLAIGTNPASGTLAGTTTVAAASGVATFSTLSLNAAGTGYTLTAAATSLTGATSGAFNIGVGAAAKLVFTIQPSNAAAGAAITPAVQVTVQDAQGNTVTTATTSITVAIGTNPASGTLAGTTTVAAASGVATFSTLSLNTAGTGYTLTATATGLTSATSNAFNITLSVGPAAKLVFTVQPSTAAAGAAITPGVQVVVQDAQGNTVTTATTSITLAIGTNPASGALTGTTTVAAVSGVATFSTLSLNRAATGYTLTATATGLTGATSSAFNISVGAAAKLVFTVQPSNTAAGAAITPGVHVTVQDAQGNTVTTATTSITLAIGTNPGSGTLAGTTTAAAVNGVATFANLSINNPGTGYTLIASATGLTGATTNAFNISVSVGPAAKLAFTVQPSNAAAGAMNTPAVQVTVQDAQGNTVTSATTSITVAIGTNPASGTLSGTKTVAAVNGVATFSTLTLNMAGTGYTLRASATGLMGATSSAFNISAGTAAKLVFTVQPSNAAAGVAITPAVQVTVQDAQGNTVTTATTSITVAIGTNPASGTLAGTTTVVAVNGLGNFSNLSLDKASAGYTLTASGGGLSGATSGLFNIVNVVALSSVSAGKDHTCGVTPGGAAYCWGANFLGNGAFGGSTTPVAVSGGRTFTAVSAGYDHSCGVTTAGAAYCWGNDNNGSYTLSSTPVAVSGSLTFASISAGYEATCGVTTGGAAYCWGANNYGQLGNAGDNFWEATPVAVSGGLTFASVSAGFDHTCGVTTGGAAYCWGDNGYGELGNGTSTSSTTPVAVSGGLTFAMISAGNGSVIGVTCGVTTSGAAYCWGDNSQGELGNATLTSSNTPVPVAGGLTFAAVSATYYVTCGVTTSGAAYCWGDNYSGQLGNGTRTSSTTPVAVLGGLTFASVTTDPGHSCGVTTSNAAYCWGDNSEGGLGDGTTTNSSTPVAVW